MQKYYVSEWALRRQAEMIALPGDFPVHTDYLAVLPKERIVKAVQTIHQMVFAIFQDIADQPEIFKMPLVEIRSDNLTKYGYPPAEAQTSKRAPYMFLDALINLLICGEMRNDEMRIFAERLLYANKNYKMNAYKGYSPKSYSLKNLDRLYAQLNRYGLYIDGMKNYKLLNGTEQIFLRYPDNADVLLVLKWMADKAHEHDRRQDFMVCHYKLLQDDMKTLSYGMGADYIADKAHTEEERDCVYRLDSVLRDNGLIPEVDNRGEAAGEDCYAVFYYAREKDRGNRIKGNFKLSSRRTRIYLSLRIKSIQNCAEQITNCSEELQSVFIPGDAGCSNRPTCKHGQAYTIGGKEYWKCGGCCKGPITFAPRKEDIPDYIKLVNLGM